MRSMLDPTHLAAAVVYSALGVAVFAAGFAVVDKLTPYDLWKEIIEKQNRALAVVVGAIAVALGLIIAAAISG
ncbi:MAG: hypothetical protein FD126_606 [Elusimicrobia bacterium]|nr:MAG: hypothetical protein FD126_606 [Elusimicrobiota bacterium]